MKVPCKTNRIYKNNIKQNGVAVELIKYFEESAELQEAICKYYAGKDSIIHIAEEIADLQIMLEQLAIIFDCKKCVKEWRKRKLERLEAGK